MKGVFFLDNYLYGGDIKYFVELINPFLKKTQNYVFCNQLDNYSHKIFKKIINRTKIIISKKNKIKNYTVDHKDCIFVKILMKIFYFFIPFRLIYHICLFSLFINKERPDFIVSMNGGYPGSLKCLSIILAAKLFGVRNYLVVASTPAKRSLKTFYDIILDLLIHFSVKLVIINSKNQLDLFKNLRFFKKEKLLQINNTLKINNKKFKKINFKKSNIYLGVVARLDKQKKIEKLIRIIQLLKNQDKNFYLNIIGDGPEKKNLLNLSKKLDVKKNINFMGFVKNDKIQKYLKKIDIFIFPSEDEGLPFSILEAVNFGLPVIAADSGGISENFKNTKEMFILKNTSLQKYINSIHKFVNNPKLAQKMRMNSFNKLKKFYDLKKNQNILFDEIKKSND